MVERDAQTGANCSRAGAAGEKCRTGSNAASIAATKREATASDASLAIWTQISARSASAASVRRRENG
jgi:hypothetical protein